MTGKQMPERDLKEGWAPGSKGLTGGGGPIKAQASPLRPPPKPLDAASSAKPPVARPEDK